MAEQRTEQLMVVDQNSVDREQRVKRVALFGSDGTARVIPTEAATVAAPAALTSAQITGAQSPTEGEHNQVQADVAAIHATLTELLVSLKAADVVASS